MKGLITSRLLRPRLWKGLINVCPGTQIFVQEFQEWQINVGLLPEWGFDFMGVQGEKRHLRKQLVCACVCVC